MSPAREVEVVEPERLLEDRRVRLLGEREHRLAVVEHVVAADLVGAVGQPRRVGVAGRREQQPARCWPRRRTTTTMSPANVSRTPSRSTTTPVTAVPRRVRLQPHGLGVREQRDVGVLERRPDRRAPRRRTSRARDRGSRRRSRSARSALNGMFASSSMHAAGRVERVVAGGREVVGELLDARLVADGGERVGRARRRLGRVLAARAVDLVELLGERVVRLHLVVARSATRARCRRGGASSPKSSARRR